MSSNLISTKLLLFIMLFRVFSRDVRAIDVVELSSKLELNIVRLAY